MEKTEKIRGGRPKKPLKDVKTRVMTVRFTETEFKLIKKQSNGMPKGEFFLRLINESQIEFVNIDDEQAIKIHRELNQIGININQIARKYNQMRGSFHTDEMIKTMRQIRDEMRFVRKGLDLYGLKK